MPNNLTPEGKAALLARLADLEVRDAANMLARATGWVVLSRDDEIPDTYYIVGVFQEAAAAMEYEQKMGKDLNENFGMPNSKGWTLFTLPMMPPT